MPCLLQKAPPPDARRTITRLGGRVVRNGLFNVLGFLIATAVGFLMAPYLLGELGMDRYGIWAIFGALASWMTLADLGMGSSLTRSVAELSSRGDHGQLEGIVNDTMVIFSAMALLAFALAWVFAGTLVGWFAPGGDSEREQLEHLLRLMAATAALGFWGSIYGAILEGLQRMDLTNLVRSAALLATVVTTVVGIERGYGLWGLAWAHLLGALLNLALTAMVVRWFLPHVPLWPRRITLGRIRGLLHFSLGVFAIQLVTYVHRQADKLILGRFGLVGAAGMYEIAAEQAYRAGVVPRLLIGPLLPAAAELSASDVVHGRTEFFIRSLRYTVLVASPLAALAATLGPAFVVLWLGAEYSVVGRALPLLVLSGFLSIITGPGVTIEMGFGRVRASAIVAGLTTITNIGLSLLLVRGHGLMGVVAATTISVCGWAVVLIVYHCRLLGVKFRAIGKVFLAPVGLAFAIGIAATLLHWPSSWGALLLEAALVTGAYILASLALRVVEWPEAAIALAALRGD